MKAHKKGFTLVELLVVIAILGVLMSVFVPKIADALTATNTAAMVNKGKQIVNAIITESMSSDPVWPLAESVSGDATAQEIYVKAYGSSTEYFKALFDIQNQMSAEHKPYINKDLIPNLWGEGVREAQPGNLTKDNIAWTILAGADDMNTDSIPVLISRNVEVSQLPTTGENNMSQKSEKLKFSSQYPKPFGDKACVVVLKGGSAFSLEDNKCTLKDMYKQSPMLVVPQAAKLKYLEP